VLEKSIAALVLCLGLVCCAAPAGVPRGASVAFDLKASPSGLEWNWQRRVAHGCVDFSAADMGWTDPALAVRLSVDPARCGGGRRTAAVCETCGPGLMYFGDNYMFFQNHYRYTREDGWNAPIFDSNGMWVASRPCPYSLSPEQLATMRLVAQEALARATTDLERRKLERIDQILAATDGAALESAQHGCSPVIRRGPSPEADSP
jgi:hypothetical protein